LRQHQEGKGKDAQPDCASLKVDNHGPLRAGIDAIRVEALADERVSARLVGESTTTLTRTGQGAASQGSTPTVQLRPGNVRDGRPSGALATPWHRRVRRCPGSEPHRPAFGWLA
jgi:hypothetical protein